MKAPMQMACKHDKCNVVQVQNANMDGGMLDLYPSPADLRKQQVADLQAKRQEKVTSRPFLLVRASRGCLFLRLHH